MFDITRLSAALPSEVTLKSVQFELLHPEKSGGESYVNLVLEGDGVLDGTFDGYCIDGDRPIDFEIDWNFNGTIDADEVGQSYSAKVYSSYDELPAELLDPGVIEKPENLDLLNWIINQDFAGQTADNGEVFTFADVQRAIWSLIDDAPPADGGFTGPDGYSWTQAKVDQIVAAALENGEGFVPGLGQKMGVILVPDDATKAGTLDTQIMFAAVELSKLDQISQLGDRVFHDTNANGIQDEGEAGIEGATVNLLQDGEVIDTATTDASGNYNFTDLRSGDYQVQFVTPDGFDMASPANQGDDKTVDSDGLTTTVTLAPGESNLTLDSGFFKQAGLGDRVWLDSNANGIQDEGELGVSNIQVELLDSNGNSFETPKTTTTDAEGNYSFEGLNPGQYQVQFVSPDGYAFTNANVEGNNNDEVDSDADPTGLIKEITLTSGDFNDTLDAGLVELANLGDRVFHDTNANGIQDEGELGVGNVQVELLDSNGNSFETPKTTTTDAEGNYSFEGLRPGEYQVQFSSPDGYAFTEANEGGDEKDELDSDAVPSIDNPSIALTQTVTLKPGEFNNTLDAGLKLASLGDRVFYDDNHNGIQDEGEEGVAGVKVRLHSPNLDHVFEVTTDANGNYKFNDLTPGDYTVEIVTDTLPDGYGLTTPNQGDNDAVDSDAALADGFMAKTTLIAGEQDMNHDAGIAKLGQIGDRVWLDTNGDGVQDGSEAGINGVTVNLVDQNGEVVDTQDTAGDGNYLFEGVAQGDYTVEVDASTLPSDLQQTGDPDANLDNMSSVSLAAGETNLSQDFGYEVATPGIDIEKFTNNVDADTANAAVEIAAGNTVTWTYEVTNTGNVTFDINDVAVTDDKEGTITHIIDQGNGDGILSPGEKWVYQKTGVAQTLTTNTASRDVRFNFDGNSALDGTNGNVRSFTAGGVSVDVSAFRRTNSGYWDNAYLGSYYGGLGVTNRGESTTSHRVDNKGSVEYLVFKFDQDVAVDKAFLKYVGSDSDISIWIGDRNGADISHLSDGQLNSFAKENNFVNHGHDRWADFNSSQKEGDTVIISAYTGGSNDSFKLQKLNVTVPGESTSSIYKNVGTVTAGGVNDSDTSHYINPSNSGPKAKDDCFTYQESEKGGWYDGKNLLGNDTDPDGDGLKITHVDGTAIGNGKWIDLNKGRVFVNKNGRIDFDANGEFDYLKNGQTAQVDFEYTISDGNGGTDTARAKLKVEGESAGTASIGNRVWEDMDRDGYQDSNEPGIKGVKVSLINSRNQTIAQTTTKNGGYYKFENLDEGNYRLKFDKSNVRHYSTKHGWVNLSGAYWTKQDKAHNSYDSDVNNANTRSNNAYTSFTHLSAGENDMSWDAGISPIIIDLNGDGVQTISRGDAQGTFDLLGTGDQIQSGWISSTDGFLAIDNNGNGTIDGLSELFGGLNKGEGFAKLASYDSNNDGIVNSDDADFDKLLIWQDKNSNHITDEGELVTLPTAGVDGLTVAYTEIPEVDAQGNLHLERSTAMLSSGQTVDMTDVYFNVSAADAAAAGVRASSFAELAGTHQPFQPLEASVATAAGQSEVF